jgi:hypothetical protein
MYGPTHSNPEDTYNISIKNVYAAGKFAVKLIGGMTNVSLYNIECKEGTQMLEDLRHVRSEEK